MYENITYESILQRMLDRIPNTLDKREGSIIYDAIAPAAIELKLAYIEFDQILNEAFADTASRDFLIRRCAERGIKPYSATKAILKAEFTPTNIELTGQRFNIGKINYTVTEKISDGIYKVECETDGTVGNQYFGDMVPIEYIEGLKTAEITDIIIPGEDEESTEELRQRYFNSFSEKAFGGNRQDYVDKTNAIAGVGASKVIPVWNGAGTVKVIIINSDFNKANDELIKIVQEEIDPTQDGTGYGIAPIGHIVTISSVDEIVVNVKTMITFSQGYDWSNLQNSIDEVISKYLSELRGKWGNQDNIVIRISQIETRLLAINGVIDVENTKLNGKTENLILGSYEIPVYGGAAGE